MGRTSMGPVASRGEYFPVGCVAGVPGRDGRGPLEPTPRVEPGRPGRPTAEVATPSPPEGKGALGSRAQAAGQGCSPRRRQGPGCPPDWSSAWFPGTTPYLPAEELPDQRGGHLLHEEVVHAAAHEPRRPQPGPSSRLRPVWPRCRGDGGVGASENSSPFPGREQWAEPPADCTRLPLVLAVSPVGDPGQESLQSQAPLPYT
jgi:hypothetical protein